MSHKKSILGCIWKEKIVDNEKIEYINKYLVKDLGIDRFTSILLGSKEIDVSKIDEFLNPRIKNHKIDPFHLLDMDKAVSRIIDAITKKQKIFIFGDYDVDGATSSALLKNVFSDIGIDVSIYIPDRIEEGYGPNNEAFRKIKEVGCDLIITVDCGTLSYEPINLANEMGVDVIVIDHHISSDELPNAYAIINPNRLDQKSDYKHLCAVGVCFIMCIALISRLKSVNYFDNIAEPNLIGYLDLVALGTVCDVMELRDINRVFVYQGLKVMNKNPNLGLHNLINISSIFEPITAYHLGFVLGPKINAGGRVGQSSLGSSLLSTKSRDTALKISNQLHEYNNQRKYIEDELYKVAYKKALEQSDNTFSFVVEKNMHIGVIGIIAGKLKEKFQKPSIVVSISDGIGKASCRSIEGIDIGTKILNAKINNIILGGGGHVAAAGFTIKEDKIPDLQKYLEKLINKKIDLINSYKKTRYYDMEMSSMQLNTNFVTSLNKLEPFGNGNEEPLFKINNLIVKSVKTIVGKHVSCSFYVNGNDENSKRYVNGIAFNAIDSDLGKFLSCSLHKHISVIASIKMNYLYSSIQLIVKDVLGL